MTHKRMTPNPNINFAVSDDPLLLSSQSTLSSMADSELQKILSLNQYNSTRVVMAMPIFWIAGHADSEEVAPGDISQIQKYCSAIFYLPKKERVRIP